MLGKHTLNPQEKTTLKITYNTAGRPGAFRKNISITTDVPGQEEVEITMEGAVKEAPGAKIQVSPRKADVGTLQRGSSKKQVFTINNGGSLPLVVKKISTKESATVYFDGAKTGDIVVEAGQSRPLEVEIRPVKPGQFTEVLLIESNAKNSPKGGFAVMVIGKSEE